MSQSTDDLREGHRLAAQSAMHEMMRDKAAPSPASGPDEGESPASKLMGGACEHYFDTTGLAPSDWWMEHVRMDILRTGFVLLNRDKLVASIRKFLPPAPAQRYPEVCEFLDAMGSKEHWRIEFEFPMTMVLVFDGSHMSAFKEPSISSACRAALDAKERADGS